MKSDPNIVEKLSSKNLLHIENVYKAYGPKTVLDDIDLSVCAGELCTVVGPSGCGKSTLLRLIVGQEQASSGTLLIDHEPVGFPDTRRGIVYQKYSLFPHLTVIENVMLAKTIMLWPWERAKRQAARDDAMFFLKRVRLDQHADKYPHELSGGMQQRVAIAQTLIQRPKIVLMDEPFGALDPGTREDMQVFLLELWQEFKMTVFFVTHDLEEGCYLGTRILVVSQFYTDDRGEGPSINRGAKIVADYPLPSAALSTEVKRKADFHDLVAQIRREGFDPQYRQHVDAFNLKHSDSFATLTEDISKPK